MRIRGIRLKTPEDIRRIRESGRILAGIFHDISSLDLKGITTWELDTIIENSINRKKARPAFKTVAGYSHSSCISVNSEVVHGIPSRKKILRDGDIVKVDIGVALNGFFSDSCVTYRVGRVSEAARRLCDSAMEALSLGISAMVPGNRLGDIGGSIQEYVESRGYSVVRTFTGHGIGFDLHEQPVVPHYGTKGSGMVLREGLVLAVEPMVNQGGAGVRTLEDGWTAVTEDGMLSAQYEHTVAITERGPVVLTE
ncbi:MAG: type I methionyl aminopeptidase [Spirochaetes bacterium]|nr:type I methionyl aminopeptidase [Spirochaetota bacterium]